jgi:hypothetical protein
MAENEVVEAEGESGAMLMDERGLWVRFGRRIGADDDEAFRPRVAGCARLNGSETLDALADGDRLGRGGGEAVASLPGEVGGDGREVVPDPLGD